MSALKDKTAGPGPEDELVHFPLFALRCFLSEAHGRAFPGWAEWPGGFLEGRRPSGASEDEGKENEPHLISLTPSKTCPHKQEAQHGHPQTRSFLDRHQIAGPFWLSGPGHPSGKMLGCGSLDAAFRGNRHQATRFQARKPLQHPHPSGLGKRRSASLGRWRVHLQGCVPWGWKTGQ